MKERPILMKADMVRAILDGQKTQTRRPVKPQPDMEIDGEKCPDGSGGWSWVPVWPKGHKWSGRMLGWAGCPFGQPGDRIWARESYRLSLLGEPSDPGFMRLVRYVADNAPRIVPQEENEWFDRATATKRAWQKRPSIHLPRWAARIILEITDVRVERLQDITEAAAKAEGVPPAWLDVNGQYVNAHAAPTFRQGFARTWNEIYAGQAWPTNPWVWVIEFRRIEA